MQDGMMSPEAYQEMMARSARGPQDMLSQSMGSPQDMLSQSARGPQDMMARTMDPRMQMWEMQAGGGYSQGPRGYGPPQSQSSARAAAAAQAQGMMPQYYGAP